MTDWLAKRHNCKHCHGTGYIGSSYIPRRANGGSHGSVMQCPHSYPVTMVEMAEAAEQEAKLPGARRTK
jgi:hypothetical protein